MAAAIYLLLVVALIALCFSCSPEVLAKIAVVGWCTSWFWRGDRISFEEMFYGDWSYHNFSLVRHVGFGQLTIVLLAGCRKISIEHGSALFVADSLVCPGLVFILISPGNV